MALGHEIAAQRESVRVLCNEPTSSTQAKWLSFGIMLAILVSVVCFILETVPQYSEWPHWNTIETVCVIIFTVEYLTRLIVSPSPLRFVIEPLNVIDLAAILPFYVTKILTAASGGKKTSMSFLRVIRMVRVFRVFKLGKYATGLNLFVQTLKLSTAALGVLSFLIVIVAVLCSTLMYVVEKEAVMDGTALEELCAGDHPGGILVMAY